MKEKAQIDKKTFKLFIERPFIVFYTLRNLYDDLEVAYRFLPETAIHFKIGLSVVSALDLNVYESKDEQDLAILESAIFAIYKYTYQKTDKIDSSRSDFELQVQAFEDIAIHGTIPQLVAVKKICEICGVDFFGL